VLADKFVPGQGGGKVKYESRIDLQEYCECGRLQGGQDGAKESNYLSFNP